MLKLLAQLEFKVADEIVHVVGAQSLTYEHLKELGYHLIKFACDNLDALAAAQKAKEEADAAVAPSEPQVLEAVPEPENKE